MPSKRILKVGVLSIAALFALVACDEIVAKPTDYSEPLVVFNNDKDASKKIYNNALQVVYDSIHDGGIGSDVLDKVLRAFSESMFGSYNELSEIVDLLPTYDTDAQSKAKVDAFIAGHKVYQSSATTEAEKIKEQKEKLQSKFDSIEEKIAETMYDKISGGSYSTRNLFSEKKFLQALRGDYKNVPDPEDPTTDYYDPQLLVPEVEPKDVFDNFLTPENYKEYIKTDVAPDIIKALLNEQYVFDETYNTLGRSYARKVNVISIKDNSDNAFASDYLMQDLIKQISEGNVDSENSLETLRTYSNAYIGYVKNNIPAQEILTRVSAASNGKAFKYKTNPDGATYAEDDPKYDPYFSSTSYGNLVEQYWKISENPHLTNSSNESDFTGSNTYTKETGRKIKEDEINLKSNTTTGWFIKNGGLTELPDAIRSRLFNIGVANGVIENANRKKEADRFYNEEDGSFKAENYHKPEDENAYVAVINGVNYLKVSSSIAGDDVKNDILHYDSSSKTYYVVQILEAVSSSKMNREPSESSINAYNRADTRKADFEDIKNEVCKAVCKGESYNSLAIEHYLKQMKMEFYDQTVYDYFLATYPDVFED